MLSMIKENKAKKTTEAPEPLCTKLSCLWRSCCHKEVSCWMPSVHSYDMLWYNLAKTTTRNQLGPLFSSRNRASDEGIYAQALTDVHISQKCAASSTSAGLKQLSQMKDEILQKASLSHQTSRPTELGWLHHRIRGWSKVAENWIFPAVTSKEVRQRVKSETGGCTYDLLQSY